MRMAKVQQDNKEQELQGEIKDLQDVIRQLRIPPDEEVEAHRQGRDATLRNADTFNFGTSI